MPRADAEKAQSDTALTEEQKKIILELYKTTPILDIAKKLFGPEIDGRSLKVRGIKVFIAGLGSSTPIVAPIEDHSSERVDQKEKESKPTSIDPIIVDASSNEGVYELSEAHKTFIVNNLDRGMSPLEVSRLLFRMPSESGQPPKDIPFWRKEMKAVARFMKSLKGSSVKPDEELVDEETFKPPASIAQLLGWCNQYIPTGDMSKTHYPSVFNNLKPIHKTQLQAQLSYIQTQKFISVASRFVKTLDRELFISTFIRFTYDKTDLAPEEVDQYIAAASETVNITQIERYVQKLEDRMEQSMFDPDEKDKTMSISWLESVNQSRSKLDASKERLKKLLESLTGSRADRIKSQVQRNQPVVPLLMAWINEERRRELIALAEKEQAEDAKEQGRLESLDDVQCLIAGMTKQEAGFGLQ